MSLLATLTGFTQAKTDWSLITPDPDFNTTMVIYTILAILVTIVQFLHCCAVIGETIEGGLGTRTFVLLFPGLLSLLALYILRAYFLTHYHSTTHLSRAVYAMLYFTEQFSNIMIAASTMILLHCAEREWYENVIIFCIRKGFATILIVAWMTLVVAQTILYRQPADAVHNALLTIALYQGRLTHAIIGFYNLVTLDITISSFVLWIRVNKLRAAETEMDQRVRALFFIAPLLAIRSLVLLIVHVISLVSVPDHLVNKIWNLIFFGWLMLDPTLCYVALYILLRCSQVPPPIRFREIVAAIFAFIGDLLEACCASCGTETNHSNGRSVSPFHHWHQNNPHLPPMTTR
ncbi:hypothetical protein C8J56DRAFT_1034024 [Mycena floridula]|nr:hypothetical protein C8J56DRAFT_1034024 [Mycena floridula]